CFSLMQRERQAGEDVPAVADDSDEREQRDHDVGLVGKLAYRMLARSRIGNQAPLGQIDGSAKAAVELIIGTGLVVKRDGEVYFRHQIIQEYFAASALRQRTVRQGAARLLADKRFSEVVALWLDLDQDRMERRLRRCLRARNLPWRRPRATSSVPL